MSSSNNNELSVNDLSFNFSTPAFIREKSNYKTKTSVSTESVLETLTSSIETIEQRCSICGILLNKIYKKCKDYDELIHNMIYPVSINIFNKHKYICTSECLDIIKNSEQLNNIIKINLNVF